MNIPDRENVYTCPRHHLTQAMGAFCTECVAFLKSAPSRGEMTADERVAEVEMWYGIDKLTVNFGDLQSRFQELCGRPIWTHEMICKDLIFAAAGSDVPDAPDPLGSLIDLVGDKPIIVVQP